MKRPPQPCLTARGRSQGRPSALSAETAIPKAPLLAFLSEKDGKRGPSTLSGRILHRASKEREKEGQRKSGFPSLPKPSLMRVRLSARVSLIYFGLSPLRLSIQDAFPTKEGWIRGKSKNIGVYISLGGPPKTKTAELNRNRLVRFFSFLTPITEDS